MWQKFFGQSRYRGREIGKGSELLIPNNAIPKPWVTATRLRFPDAEGVWSVEWSQYSSNMIFPTYARTKWKGRTSEEVEELDMALLRSVFPPVFDFSTY